MSQVITNPYHLEVVKNLITHPTYKHTPVFYIVDLVKKLFPEYRDQDLHNDLVNQIDLICLEAGK